MSDDNKRIAELENKLAFLEAANQEFGELIYDQQKQIDQLVKYVKHELSRLAVAEGTDAEVDEVPPHY